MNCVRTVGLALALGGAALGGLSAVASAGEFDRWGGLYAGIHAGYGWADADWKLAYPFGNAPPSSSFDMNDGLAGGHIGLQHQFGRWVIGGELSASSGLGSHTVGGVNLWAPNLGTLTAEVDWLFTATGRIGYAWDRWLGYVKGGYAGAMMTLSADDHVPPNFGFETRGLHHGWTIGAGLEHQISKGVIIGVEYNYIELNENFATPVVVLPGTPLGVSAYNDVETSIQTITARLSFKLGRDEDRHESMK